MEHKDRSDLIPGKDFVAKEEAVTRARSKVLKILQEQIKIGETHSNVAFIFYKAAFTFLQKSKKIDEEYKV